MKFWRLSGAVILAVSCFIMPVHKTLAQTVASPEIWFGPAHWYSTPENPHPRAVDLMDMFRPDAPWQNAASHIQVFRMGAVFFHRLGQESNQDEVNAFVADMKRRHIAIALEIGVINITPGSCPDHIQEGYGNVSEARKVIDMIKAAGGEIKYLNMDEELKYGHFFERSATKTGCQLPISEIIDRSKELLSLFKQEFPNITVGETEPTSIMREEGHDHKVERPDWKDAMLKYYLQLRDVLGQPLDFLILDPQWEFKRGSAAEDVETVYDYAEELKQRGLIKRIGIMYKGGGPFDKTDAAWVRDARDHMAVVEKKFRPRPDIIAFLSWEDNPSHALPDDPSRDTLAGLVTYYFNRYAAAQAAPR